jgi:hypothetical protein
MSLRDDTIANRRSIRSPISPFSLSVYSSYCCCEEFEEL